MNSKGITGMQITNSWGYGYLWTVLYFLGVDIYDAGQNKMSSSRKNFSNKVIMKILFPFIMYFMIIYVLSHEITYAVTFTADIKIPLCFIIINLFSLALWHDVNRKRAFIRDFIVKCKKLGLCLQRSLTNINTIINSCLVLIVFIVITAAAVCIFCMKYAPRELHMYFSFFMLADGDDIISMLVKDTLIVMQFVCLFIPPALAALLSGTIFFKTGDLIGKLRENLENIKLDVPCHNEISKISMNYNYLYVLVHEVEKEFSPTNFLIVCSQWFNLNTVLLCYILYKGDLLSYSLGSQIIAE
ncbi:uncharacterized protein CDAR_126781 [Caerostris darwini]|uniref:Gustatory receptor n=1 Tax=Caerostris darwini TaxID=1538125 RepID=A0AAV4RG46_9ARAC|nr:uncharacterized protein CDAR_126781 [Caerostris darwini]